MRFTYPANKDERGVTILIVGVTLLALVAMAALAIDVASLYTARSEAQRAADAAALAGAKMFVSSSFTSRPAGWTLAALCESNVATSTGAVNQQAALAAASNLIAGKPAEIQNIQCNFDDADSNTNPRVTVTVKRVGTPLFFGRIFNVPGGLVTATATAEAYNMSGHDTPIELTGVKPWLIPNCDPHTSSPGPCSGGYFFNPADGSLKNNTVIGSQLLLHRVLNQSQGLVGGTGTVSDPQMNFYGLDFPASPSPVCPSTGAVSCGPPVGSGGNVYVDNIACASRLQMSCGTPIGAGQIITADTDTAAIATSPTSTGGRCLIHADGDLALDGQDSFSTGSVPVTITGGTHNPNSSLQGVTNISRSDSVVTLPVDEGAQLCTSSSCLVRTKIIGFLQVGVLQTTGGPDVPVVILNAVGCSQNAVDAYPPDNPIVGEGSPIPVRLVQTPTP